MVLAVAPEAESQVLKHLRTAGEPGARRIGEVVRGTGVQYEGKK
jgi:hypothetical protein